MSGVQQSVESFIILYAVEQIYKANGGIHWKGAARDFGEYDTAIYLPGQRYDQSIEVLPISVGGCLFAWVSAYCNTNTDYTEETYTQSIINIIDSIQYKDKQWRLCVFPRPTILAIQSKTMMRTFESHWESLSQYGMKHFVCSRKYM